MQIVFLISSMHFLIRINLFGFFFGFSAAILFVSSVPERNRMDHVWMEKKIWELDQSIDVMYCSLTSLTSVMSIGRDKALFLLVFPISLS